MHLRPALIDSLLQADETIVAASNCNCSNYDDEKQNGDEDAATEREFVHNNYDNCERSFFQDRSDLRSDHLPLTALFHKCVGPDEFSVEEILLSLVRFDDALADDDSSVAIKRTRRLSILNSEKTMSPVMLSRSPRLFTILPSGHTIVQSSASSRRVYELSPLTRASAHSR